jgi:hypothetical protein
VYFVGTQIQYENIGFEVGKLGSHPVYNTERGAKENFSVQQKRTNQSAI